MAFSWKVNLLLLPGFGGGPTPEKQENRRTPLPGSSNPVPPADDKEVCTVELVIN
jgi:hypothetical protein